MILGAKLALLLSFNHSATDNVFDQLADYLKLKRLPSMSISFAISDGKLEVESVNGIHHQSQIDLSRCMFGISEERGFIPLTLSFTSSCIKRGQQSGPMHHQAVVFLGKDIELMEPYGKFIKKLDDIHYDYYSPLKSIFAGCGNVRQSDIDIQTLVLDNNEKVYVRFLEEFSREIAQLRPRDTGIVNKLKEHLRAIDLSSQSSKLTYVVTIVDVLRSSEHLSRFLKFYEEYSPYSCVAFTIIAIYCHFTGSKKMEALSREPTNQLLWRTLEEVLALVAPDLVQHVDANSMQYLLS